MLKEFLRKQMPSPPGSVAYRQEVGNFTSKVGVFANVLLSVFKIFIGIVSASVSVVADGLNNLSDTLVSLVSWASFIVVTRPPDEEHPYGHARFEYVSSSILALIIMGMATFMFIQSVGKIKEPQEISLNFWLLVILVFSNLLKLGMYYFYKHYAKAINSDIIEANALDSISDVLATTGVLASLAIYHFFRLNLDGYFGIFVSLSIARAAWEILARSFTQIMGNAPDPKRVQYLKEKIEAYEGVIYAHDFIIHDYGPGISYATADVGVDAREDIMKSHELVDQIERDLAADDQVEISIHMEPVDLQNPLQNALEKQVEDLLQEFNSDYSIYDFRILDRAEKHYMIFDLKMPIETKEDTTNIRNQVLKLLNEHFPDWEIILTVSRIFAL